MSPLTLHLLAQVVEDAESQPVGSMACGHARDAKRTTLECMEAMARLRRQDVFEHDVGAASQGLLRCRAMH